jgi:hypothetical protein
MAYGKTNERKTDFKHDPNPWEERQKRIDSLLADFRKHLQYSSLYLEAEREGYGLKFYRYACHVARIQAQFITGAAVGYDHQIIFNGKKTTGDDCWKFLRYQERACADGMINVVYPSGLLAEWSREAKPAV